MSKSVAVVTGASQGIGQATAIRLARDFSALVLVARNRAHLEQTADAVRAAGAEALIIDIDLAQPSAAQAVVDQALQAFGRIDALLNIAGAVEAGPKDCAGGAPLARLPDRCRCSATSSLAGRSLPNARPRLSPLRPQVDAVAGRVRLRLRQPRSRRRGVHHDTRRVEVRPLRAGLRRPGRLPARPGRHGFVQVVRPSFKLVRMLPIHPIPPPIARARIGRVRISTRR